MTICEEGGCFDQHIHIPNDTRMACEGKIIVLDGLSEIDWLIDWDRSIDWLIDRFVDWINERMDEKMNDHWAVDFLGRIVHILSYIIIMSWMVNTGFRKQGVTSTC